MTAIDEMVNSLEDRLLVGFSLEEIWSEKKYKEFIQKKEAQ